MIVKKFIKDLQKLLESHEGEKEPEIFIDTYNGVGKIIGFTLVGDDIYIDYELGDV